jgi:hypothetical protein
MSSLLLKRTADDEVVQQLSHEQGFTFRHAGDGVGGRYFTLQGSSHGGGLEQLELDDGLEQGLEQGLEDSQLGFGVHSFPLSLNVILTSSSPLSPN